MARRKTRGWYWFEDGYCEWVNGYSQQELAVEIRKHGKVVRFEPTD